MSDCVWPKLGLITVVAIASASCTRQADRVKATNGEEVGWELGRLRNALPDHEKAAFEQAVLVLTLLIEAETGGDESKADAMTPQRFNGKTVAEIIADYNQLPLDVRDKYGAAISEFQKGNSPPLNQTEKVP